MKTLFSLALIPSLVLSGAPVRAQASTSDWARVVAIAPGATVVVTVKNATPVRLRIVQADEFALTVVNPRTQRAEAIARGEVLDARPSDKRRALGLLGGLGGAIVGALFGGMAGSAFCRSENLSCMMVGMNVGMVGGAVVGNRAVTRTKGDVIYRAP
jgi:hypothetical protein